MNLCDIPAAYHIKDTSNEMRLGVVAYTLDKYKQECRDRTEKMRSDLLERLTELDASRATEISEALGDAESFITKRLVEDGGTPTETI